MRANIAQLQISANQNGHQLQVLQPRKRYLRGLPSEHSFIKGCVRRFPKLGTRHVVQVEAASQKARRGQLQGAAPDAS